MREFLAFGEPLVGFYPPREASVVDDVPITKTWGGDTSNFAIGVARLGHSVSYYSAVGDDPFGKGFIALWKHNGVDTSLVSVDGRRRTGLYFVSFEGERHIFTYYRKGSAASAMLPERIPCDIAEKYAVLHLSGISLGMSTTARATGFALMRAFRKAGKLISFDINYRSPQWISTKRASGVFEEAVAIGIDILEITDEEMSALGWGKNLADLRYKFSAVPTIVMKKGPRGVSIDAEGDSFDMPAFSISVKDTVGAGDSFDAGYLSAIVEGVAPREAARFAAATAALTCTGTGPLEKMPFREEVLHFLASNS